MGAGQSSKPMIGQGGNYGGSIRGRDILDIKSNRSAGQIAGTATVHEAVYHGMSLEGVWWGHDHETGFVDSKSPSAQKAEVLSNDAGKAFVDALGAKRK